MIVTSITYKEPPTLPVGKTEYIITCKTYEDLQSLYDDMETPGGSLYIPDRAVDLVHRRAISRNTHYILSEEEAVEIRKDERVIACELPAQKRGIEPIKLWTQTGDFDKVEENIDNNDKNWGLYRMIKGDSVSNWGSNSTTEISNKTISTTASGKNVDVVIVDEHVRPDHPEFAVNPDGTGGSRVNQFNWFQYKSALGYNSHPSTYTYSDSAASPNGNHGTHVAGTVAGNRQGWARDANIYNMSFLDSLSGVTDWDQFLWDYLRYFHKNKAINPETGRRNPTITNHSWGYSSSSRLLSDITLVTHRGTTTNVSGYSASAKKTFLEDRLVPVIGNDPSLGFFVYRPPARVAAVDADIQDAINDGVIVISAAGNSFWNCEEFGGQDYDNRFVASPFSYYHSRGSTPSAADNVICVGAIGAKVAEHKADFSNWGGRVDIWAPGENIISSMFDNIQSNDPYPGAVSDPRSVPGQPIYNIGSISGTSMASPQICGIIACLTEQEPNLTQAEALQHLIENSLPEVGSNGNPTQTPYEGFGDSNNRYSFIPKKRSDDGMASPAQLHKNRNTSASGVKYPRVRYQTTS